MTGCRISETCCFNVVKIVLITVNSILTIVGIAIFSIGITVLVHAKNLIGAFQLVHINLESILSAIGLNEVSIVTSIGIYLVIFGIFFTTISLFGFFGACCEHRPLLIAFSALLFAVVIIEIPVIVIVNYWPDRIRFSAREGMVKTLNESFQLDMSFSGENITMSENRIELAWATLQLSLECCGAHGFQDYSRIAWNRTYCSSAVNVTNATVPSSCCQRHRAWKKLPIPNHVKEFKDLRGCLEWGDADSTNTVGCYQGVVDVAVKYVSGVIGIAVAVAVVELLQIQFAICMCIYVTVRESLDRTPYKRIKP